MKELRLHELPATLLKHAILPGAAVQALEEAAPDSNIGQTVQKSYPRFAARYPVRSPRSGSPARGLANSEQRVENQSNDLSHDFRMMQCPNRSRVFLTDLPSAY